MKIIKTIIFCVIVCFLFAGCYSNNNNLLDSIEIADQYVEDSNIDNIISEMKFVPLETNNESIIKEISKIIFVNDTMIIGDFRLGKIFIFNSNGSFIHCISDMGKGPNEYLEINDITYDENSKKLLVLSLFQHHVISYSLADFKGTSNEIESGNAGYKFEWVNDIIAFYRQSDVFKNHSSHNLTLVKNMSTCINSGVSIPDQIKNFCISSFKNMDTNLGILYFTSACNDTIFVVDKNYKISPKYHIMIPKSVDVKHSDVWKKKNNDMVNFTTRSYINGFIFNMNKMFVTNKYLTLEYYSKYRNLAIFDIKNSKTINYKNPTFTSQDILLNLVGKKDDVLVAEVGANEEYLKLNAILDNKINEYSNPVLCFILLK